MSKFLDNLCIDVNDCFNVDILKKTRKTEVVKARVCFIVLAARLKKNDVIGAYIGLDRTSVINWLNVYEYKLDKKHYEFLDKYKVEDSYKERIKMNIIQKDIRKLIKLHGNDNLKKIRQFIKELE